MLIVVLQSSFLLCRYKFIWEQIIHYNKTEAAREKTSKKVVASVGFSLYRQLFNFVVIILGSILNSKK